MDKILVGWSGYDYVQFCHKGIASDGRPFAYGKHETLKGAFDAARETQAQRLADTGVAPTIEEVHHHVREPLNWIGEEVTMGRKASRAGTPIPRGASTYFVSAYRARNCEIERAHAYWAWRNKRIDDKTYHAIVQGCGVLPAGVITQADLDAVKPGTWEWQWLLGNMD